MNPEKVPKKRGRKRKEDSQSEALNNENITLVIEESSADTIVHTAPKKRGRKPKGGKLITKQPENAAAQPPVSNVILHLKCSMLDLLEHNKTMTNIVLDPLVYNPVAPPDILTYNDDHNSTFSNYNNDVINKTTDLAYCDFIPKPLQIETNVCNICSSTINDSENLEIDDTNIKDINVKLKKLKIQLYKNTNQEKKSACFWCTYDYDNPSCYIPKYEMDKEIYGYGSFCRPECAAAYLMRENIDDSTKFERYHLLNQIYGKVYNFKKNIKPAPNPYYLLDKFYGNLTIQEYRKLLKSEHMLLVIEKPMTRTLPELHEDNEEFIMNIYGGSTSQSKSGGGAYKVKRESEKKQGPSKSSIIKDRFGVKQ